MGGVFKRTPVQRQKIAPNFLFKFPNVAGRLEKGLNIIPRHFRTL